jgi:hypothetical protein
LTALLQADPEWNDPERCRPIGCSLGCRRWKNSGAAAQVASFRDVSCALAVNCQALSGRNRERSGQQLAGLARRKFLGQRPARDLPLAGRAWKSVVAPGSDLVSMPCEALPIPPQAEYPEERRRPRRAPPIRVLADLMLADPMLVDPILAAPTRRVPALGVPMPDEERPHDQK